MALVLSARRRRGGTPASRLPARGHRSPHHETKVALRARGSGRFYSPLRGVFSAFGQPKVLVPYTADNTQGDAPAEGLNPLTNGQACFGPVLREGPRLRDGLRREVSYPHPGLSGGWNRPRTGIREQGSAGEALWSGGGNI